MFLNLKPYNVGDDAISVTIEAGDMKAVPDCIKHKKYTLWWSQ